MNFRQKLAYTTFGMLLTVMGMWIGSTIVPPVTAQRDTDIVCTSLTVVDKAGNPCVIIKTTENGGDVTVTDKTKKSGVSIGNDSKYGGWLTVYDEIGTSIVGLTSHKYGGGVIVYDKTGRKGIYLFTDEYGGEIATYDEEVLTGKLP